MRVTTRNVSFERVFVAEGKSEYVASSSSSSHTHFSMHMVVTASIGVLSHRRAACLHHIQLR
jgi:hypothetical protein